MHFSCLVATVSLVLFKKGHDTSWLTSSVPISHVPAFSFAVYLQCGTSFSAKDGFVCPRDARNHSLCPTCFNDYIKHCCSESASLSSLRETIPITCSIPACAYQLPDAVMKTLLLKDACAGGVLTWDAYQTAQLKQGLIRSNHRPPQAAFVSVH